MAEMVRQQEDLLSVYLTIERRRDGPRLKGKLFRGDAIQSEPLSLRLSQLGHTPRDRQARGHQMCFPEPQVPPRLYALFHQAKQMANLDEVIWLQIGYGADVLGAFPWEERIGQELGRTLLRIPNFARNTYSRADGQDPIAVCAATPKAKGAPNWRPAMHNLLSGLRAPNPVVLYIADEEAIGEFSESRVKDAYPHLNVSVAPSRPTNVLERERFISDRNTVSNPWLRWIADDLGDRFSGCAQAVHMICSGYSQEARGALALPQSPSHDDDERWARFVGVSEFARFADQIKCQITGLTAVGAPRWREGLRLFSNELSWKRPGPILLEHGDGSANRAYCVLLDGQKFDTAGVTNTAISAHPKALIEGVHNLALTRSALALDKGQADFSAEMAFVEFYDTPASGLSSDAPLPDELMRVMDRISSARPKSVLRTAQDRGTLNALKFLQSLPRDGDAN